MRTGHIAWVMAGSLIGAGFAAGQDSTAERRGVETRSPDQVQKTVTGAKVTLPDAIKTAERASGGRACCAEIVEWQQLNTNLPPSHSTEQGRHELKPNSPVARIVCVTNDRVVEALVCCTTGDVIDKRESKEYRPGMSAFMGSPGGRYASGSSYEELWFRAPSRWQKCSDVIGKPVTAQGSGEHIADVKELVVDPDGGRVLYTIVEFHGKMGHGNRWFAIPIQSTRLSDDYKTVVLEYSTSGINAANGFDRNSWPNMTDEVWAVRIHGAYGQHPYWKEESKSSGAERRESVQRDTAAKTRDADWRTAPRRWQKASDLMGKEVRNPQNENLGQLKEIVIDADSGRILYGVLSFGGFLGVGDKLFAIPWGSLDLAQDYKSLALDVDKERLKNAEGFDKNKWPDMADARWAATVYDYYGRPRYWER